jgi:hypothetical protein
MTVNYARSLYNTIPQILGRNPQKVLNYRKGGRSYLKNNLKSSHIYAQYWKESKI